MKKMIVLMAFFGTMLTLIGVSDVLAAPTLGVADVVTIRVAKGNEGWSARDWLEINTYGTGGDGWAWLYSSNPISYDTGVKQTVNHGDLATGRAISSADFGTLGVYAANTGFDTNSLVPVAHANVWAGAMWRDTWNIGASGMTGRGNLNIGFSVDGNLYHNPVPSHAIPWYYGFSVEDGPFGGWYGYTSSDSWPPDVSLPVNPVHVTGIFGVPFNFNQPFDINFMLFASDGNADVTYSWSSVTDFLHTAKLTGMYVSDNAGNQINNYAFDTNSGHNYFPSAVPEPASLFLLGIGASVMALLKRKKKII